MIDKIPTEKLEVAFEFIRIAHERGGYKEREAKRSGIPTLGELIRTPFRYTHLPEPPRKVRMQMWRSQYSVELRATPVKQPPFDGSWLKVGEPFEFELPEEVR